MAYVYEITTDGWLAPGWYIAGREYLGPYDSREDAVDVKRRRNTATSKALIRAVRYCPACNRGALSTPHDTEGGLLYHCRYCGHEWLAGDHRRNV